jgi:DNA primase
VSVLEFEVSSVLAAAKLDTARGRDQALAALLPIFATAEEGAVKDEQLRKVADRLQLSEASLGRLRSARAESAGRQTETRAGDPQAARPAVSAERELAERLFMAMCLGEKAEGRAYLEKLSDEQLSTPLMRELRDHLVSNYENPLSEAAGLKAELRDAVTEVAMLSERENASAMAIRLGFLQLKKAGLDRSLAGAPAADKVEIERRRQEVIKELGDLTAEYA